MIVCPSCGTENPERARFCLECATPLVGAAQAPAKSLGVRKLVTVLFADAIGSTALGERIDPETMRGALSRSFTVAREVLERHGGTVEKFIGDAVMAVFGVPVLHEDDALRAARAATELRDRLAALDREIEAERGLRIRFRIGVNTGEVVAGGADQSSSSLVTGDAVNTAARLEQAAQPGEILIGKLTNRLVHGRASVEAVHPFEAKGKAEPLAAFRLLSVEPAEAEMGYRRLSARMVGRQRELARLEEAFGDAQAQRRCHLFTLLGTAGVGKSRLVAEFLVRLEDRATVVRGRCLPYGEGITFWPIGEMVRAAAGFGEGDDSSGDRQKLEALLAGEPEAERIATLVASAIGLSDEAVPREEIFWAVRRLLERLASERPVVCVIDDIHWAEPTLLDLIEHVADWSRNAPILLVCLARPELLEDRPTWAGGKLNATTILLEPLAPEITRELVLDLLDSATLPEPLTARILDTAEGNPLFAEEIVRMLVDEGLLRPSNGGWVADDRLETVPMPTSVQAVIAARLDRLPAPERTVAERAAVVGRVFEQAAVAELVPDDLRGEVPARLLALVRKELVRPDRSDLSLEEAYRFRHLLIRDTAYEAIPKEERAELHERFAAWLERVTGERVVEFEEIVGYHYEQAHRYRTELGLLDERTERLAERAGRHLTEAGRRAYVHGDWEAATKLLLRGSPRMPTGRERGEALLMLAMAARSGTRWADTRRAVEQLLQEAAHARDAVLEMKGRVMDVDVQMFTNPGFLYEDALATIAEAVPVFEAVEDHQGLAMARAAEAALHLGAARWTEVGRVAELVIAEASAVGDRTLEDIFRAQRVLAALWGPTPLPQVLVLAGEQMASVRSRLAMPQIQQGAALAHAWSGEAEKARAQIRECYAVRDEVLGKARTFVFTAGPVEMALGELDAAEAELRRTSATLEALGETGTRCTIVGLLAYVEFRLGRPDPEILADVELTKRLASRDDAEAQSSWRMTKALVEARAGRITEAQRLADEAVEITSTTDFVMNKVRLLEDQAWILERAGRTNEARRDLREALSLAEHKGALVEIPRIHERLKGLAAPGS